MGPETEYIQTPYQLCCGTLPKGQHRNQEQQLGSAQVTDNVDPQGSGCWAGRVPGTPISHCDEQQRSCSLQAYV
ncbi:hypothetical protein WJX79_009949 [Trebouxia sp. C0005]